MEQEAINFTSELLNYGFSIGLLTGFTFFFINFAASSIFKIIGRSV